MRNAIKVLIIDDDRASATLLGEVVKRLGFKPVIVNKATDGLNVAKLQTVHAAIIDVLLPKIGGVDLASEFRKTKFGENPIILVSGVFKDKNFAAEAIKKTGALEFLFKPFNAEDLQAALKKALAGQLTTEKMTVQSLLVRRLSSAREKAKAIEHLEQVRGQEFPFVVSVLLDAGLSGHLNIVNDLGEIFGITFSRGTIAEVDSTESQAQGVLALIRNGFITQEDWDSFQDGKKKFPLDRLVQEGLVSPHAVAVAKHEQILHDFKSICSSATMQVNFVPQDESEEPPKHAVKMKELLRIMASAMDEFFPEAYLAEFYSVVKASPMQLTRSLEEMAPIWSSKHFSPYTQLRKVVEEGGTLDMALRAHPGQSAQIYRCMHYLVLSRNVVFDDVQRAKSLHTMMDRYQRLFADLSGKSADKIIEYFGAEGERPTPSAVLKIWEDYRKSNSPDQLPSDASPELHELCQRVYDLISNAKDVMADEQKRAVLYESLRLEGAARLKKSNEHTAQALDLLRKGQFDQAVEACKQAANLHPTSLQFLIQTWAQVKGGMVTQKPALQELVKKLDQMPPDDRKSTYWFMTMGILKKALLDVAAIAMFEKVVEMDSTFVEARRELNSISQSSARKVDILNGDISTVVSQLFRTKAK